MSTPSHVGNTKKTGPNRGRWSFEQLCSADPSALDGRGLRAALEACRRYRARIDAVEARLITAGDASGAFAVGGAVDAAGYLREQHGLSGREARVRSDTAEALRDLPATAAALESGEIGFEHTTVIAKAADEAHRDAIVAGEQQLVAEAKELPADRFKRVVRSFCDQVDRDGGLGRQERLRERRSVSQRVRCDGMGITVLELPPDGHAYYRSALGAIAEEMWRADHPDTSDPVPVEARSNRQRLADAAVEMARRALGVNPAVAREARPLVIAKIDYHDLVGRLQLGSAEIAGVGPVPADTARRVACDCELLPAIFGGAGESLDAGRSLRLPTRAMRRVLIARDGGCRFPGCDRPHEWCEAHHIQFWDEGGPTSVENLLMLCCKHHHLVHEGGWRITGNATSITVRRPDASVLVRDLGPPVTNRSPGPNEHDPPDSARGPGPNEQAGQCERSRAAPRDRQAVSRSTATPRGAPSARAPVSSAVSDPPEQPSPRSRRPQLVA